MTSPRDSPRLTVHRGPLPPEKWRNVEQPELPSSNTSTGQTTAGCKGGIGICSRRKGGRLLRSYRVQTHARFFDEPSPYQTQGGPDFEWEHGRHVTM
jgi:hypothetical protein